MRLAVLAVSQRRWIEFESTTGYDPRFWRRAKRLWLPGPLGPPGGTVAARCTSVGTAIRPVPPPLQHSSASLITWGLVGFLRFRSTYLSPFVHLPLLLVVLIFAARRYGVGVGTIGLTAGVGLACLGIGVINLGSRPCPSSPFVIRS